MIRRVVGIGEVLWDLLPDGAKLGGAPANFAYHAGVLGTESRTISRVGNDTLGHDILDRLAALGVSTECVQVDPSRATGTVDVTIDADGQPHYTITPDVAWDHLDADERAIRTVSSADAVCFGSLAQRAPESRAAIRTLLSHAPFSAVRILDVNLRQAFYSADVIGASLDQASVLKVNDAELPILAELFGMQGEPRAVIDRMMERWQLRAVAYTRGGGGSLLRTEHAWSDHPGFPVQVVDTIGAGDAFTAAMTVGLLAGWELDAINQHANRVASFVASCAGGTPVLPDTIRAPFLRETRGT